MSLTEIIAILDSSINNAVFSPMYCNEINRTLWYDVKFIGDDIRFSSIIENLEVAKADNLVNSNYCNEIYLGGNLILDGKAHKLCEKDFFGISTT